MMTNFSIKDSYKLVSSLKSYATTQKVVVKTRDKFCSWLFISHLCYTTTVILLQYFHGINPSISFHSEIVNPFRETWKELPRIFCTKTFNVLLKLSVTEFRLYTYKILGLSNCPTNYTACNSFRKVTFSILILSLNWCTWFTNSYYLRKCFIINVTQSSRHNYMIVGMVLNR